MCAGKKLERGRERESNTRGGFLKFEEVFFRKKKKSIFCFGGRNGNVKNQKSNWESNLSFYCRIAPLLFRNVIYAPKCF